MITGVVEGVVEGLGRGPGGIGAVCPEDHAMRMPACPFHSPFMVRSLHPHSPLSRWALRLTPIARLHVLSLRRTFLRSLAQRITPTARLPNSSCSPSHDVTSFAFNFHRLAQRTMPSAPCLEAWTAQWPPPWCTRCWATACTACLWTTACCATM